MPKFVRFVRTLFLFMAVSLFVAAAMECVARVARYAFSRDVYPRFTVTNDYTYMVNEFGGVGFLRPGRKRFFVAVVGGSPAFHNGFNLSWPSFVGRAFPNGHLDNFSTTFPHSASQLAVLARLEELGLKYDLLLFEPPWFPGAFTTREAWEREDNAWRLKPLSLGALEILFPRILMANLKKLFKLDGLFAKFRSAAKGRLTGVQEEYNRYLETHGSIHYRDIPDYFNSTAARAYEARIDSILERAKRVAKQVVVVAPIIHFHNAPDKSDRDGFAYLFSAGDGFISLQTLAEAIWAENELLRKLAARHGVKYYDGNAEFSHRPDHREIFDDQDHLVTAMQPILAERILELLHSGDPDFGKGDPEQN